MAQSASQIRDLLLPGLYEVRGSWADIAQYQSAFVINAPEDILFKAVPSMLSLPTAAAMGAAAALIKNPQVTRRFWAS